MNYRSGHTKSMFSFVKKLLACVNLHFHGSQYFPALKIGKILFGVHIVLSEKMYQNILKVVRDTCFINRN